MKPVQFKVSLLTTAFLMTAYANAAEANVTWQDPQNYTDIGSNFGSQTNFQKSLFKTLDGVFSEQAARLPDGSRLTVTVSNFDMAGAMRTGGKGTYQRVVQQSLFPQMTLSYRLTDATGAVIAEQKDVVFQDMDFTNLTNTVSQSERNEPYYYEGAMIAKWFDRTFRLSDGQL
jgi:Protein of unknown function (DUF3016)